MAELGFHCFAPDWIGFGFSDKPQPGYGFNYTGFLREKYIRMITIINYFNHSHKNHTCNDFLIILAEKEFHEGLDKLLEKLEVKSPFFLVVQVCTTA